MTKPIKVRVSKEELRRQYNWGRLDFLGTSSTDFIELTGEAVEEKCPLFPHCSHNTSGRDLSKPCSISVLTHINTGLDRQFGPEEKRGTCFGVPCSHNGTNRRCTYDYLHAPKGPATNSEKLVGGLVAVPEPLENEEVNRANIVRIACENRNKINEVLSYLKAKQ